MKAFSLYPDDENGQPTQDGATQFAQNSAAQGNAPVASYSPTAAASPSGAQATLPTGPATDSGGAQMPTQGINPAQYLSAAQGTATDMTGSTMQAPLGGAGAFAAAGGTPTYTPQTPPSGGYSWTDPTSGQSMNGATAPTGVPAYGSSLLTQNANGSTQSATATPTNAFAGYVGPSGGTFGGPGTAATGVNPTAANSGGYYQGTDTGQGFVNGQAVAPGQTNTQAVAQTLAQQGVSGWLSNAGMQGTLASATPAWFHSLTPEFQQQLVQQTANTPLGAKYAALAQAAQAQPAAPTSPASSDPTTIPTSTFAINGGIGATPGSATPASSTGTAQLPSGQATDTTPSQTPNATLAASGTSGANGAGSASNVGSGNASMQDIVSLLTGGMNGQSAGSPLLNATSSSIQNSLNNPLGGYGLPQVAQIRAANDADTNAQFAAQQKQLDDYLASRGIGASSFGGGYQGDLAGQQARAIASNNAALTANAAQLGQQGTQAAQYAGVNAANSANTNQQNFLSQSMNYGQNAYNNDLNTASFNANQQNNYQNWLMQLLGMGYSPTG